MYLHSFSMSGAKMFTRFAAMAAVVVGLSTASTAFATPQHSTLGATPCLLTDITPNAIACSGWWTGNLDSNNATDLADSATALNALLGVNTFTGPTLTWLEDINASGGTVNFATPLFGLTVVAFHVGAAVGATNGVGYDGTAFYEFNAGNPPGGLDTFSFNRPGLSNARLFSTGGPGVPEPASWALMILGFAGLGGMLRRRRSTAAVAA